MNFKIIEHPLLKPRQKIKISEDCPMTDKCRMEMNCWLLEMFGYTESLCYLVGNHTLYMPPDIAVIYDGV